MALYKYDYLTIYNSNNTPVTSNYVSVGPYSSLYEVKMPLVTFKHSRIKQMYLCICVTNSSNPLNNIRLKYNSTYISASGINSLWNNFKQVRFDLKALFSSFSSFSNLYFNINNNSNETINLYTQNYGTQPIIPYLYIQYEEELTYPKSDAKMSFNVENFIDFNFNFAAGRGIFTKRLFENILPYELNFVFDPIDITFKLSFFENLNTVTYELSNSELRKTYFTNQAIGNVNFHVDKEGSGQVLEKDGNNYYIYSPLNSNIKKIFDSDGQLVSVIDNYGRTISYSYEEESATEYTKSITDYNNNVVAYECVPTTQGGFMDGGVINITYNSTLFYQFACVIDNNVKHFEFREYRGSNIFKTIYFYKESNQYISKAICNGVHFDLFFNYSRNKITQIKKFVGISGADFYDSNKFDYTEGYDRVTHKNGKNVEKEYIFDDDLVIKSIKEIYGEEEIDLYSTNSNGYIKDLHPYQLKVSEEEGQIAGNNLGQVYLDGSHSSTGSVTIVSLNSLPNGFPFSISSDSCYIFTFVLSTSAEITTFNQNKYVYLRYIFDSPATLSSGNLIYFRKEGDQVLASFVLKTGSSVAYNNLNVNLVASGYGNATFSITQLLIRKSTDYEELSYFDNSTSFSSQNPPILKPLYNSYYALSYHLVGINANDIIPMAYLTTNDVKINNILFLKEENFIFYNNLKNVITHFFEADTRYFFEGDSNGILLKNLSIIEKKLNNGITKYKGLGLTNNDEIFSYQNNAPKDPIFNNSSTHETYTIFDDVFKIKESKDINGIQTINTYGTNGELLNTGHGKTGAFDEQTFTYSNDKLYTLVEKVANKDVVTTYTLDNVHHSFPVMIEKEEDINNPPVSQTIEYDYDSNQTFNNISEIDIGSSSNYIQTGSKGIENATVVNNKPKFYFYYDKYNQINRIRDNNNIDFLTINRYLSNTQNEITYTYPNGYSKTAITNKFDNISEIKEGSATKVNFTYAYLYIDNGAVAYDQTKLTSLSRLYIVNDYYINQRTKYDYNTLGQISRQRLYALSNNDQTLKLRFDYTYNSNNQVSSCVVTGFNGVLIDYETEATYDSNNEEIVSSTLTHRLNGTPYSIIDSVKKDNLNRLDTYNVTRSGNTLTNDYSYHGNTKYVSHKNVWLGNNLYLNESVNYDTNGNISSISKSDANIMIYSYEYDMNNRLLKESSNLQQSPLVTYIQYTYDTNGNITQIRHHYISAIGSDDYEYFTYDTTFKDKLREYQLNNDTPITITYDNNDNGLNPITIGDKTLVWTRGTLLESIITGSGHAPKYGFSYNKDGIRTIKSKYTWSSQLSAYQLVKSHEYFLDGNKIIAEKIVTDGNQSTAVYIRYYHGLSGVEGFLYNGNVYLYVKDSLNNIVAIVDSSLSIQAKYEYDAFGNTKVLNPDGTVNTASTFIGNINPFRYKGYYYDSELEMYYCNSRYYYPLFRRWLNADDLSYLDEQSIDGLNLYCSNKLSNHNVKQNNSVVKKLSKSDKEYSFFGAKILNIGAFDTDSLLVNNWLFRIGLTSYTTITSLGNNGVIYAFCGTNTNLGNMMDTTYFAGIGIDLFGKFGTSIQLETLGLGVSINIFGLEISLDLNLIGQSSLFIGITQTSGNNSTTSNGFLLSMNTGALIAIIASIYGFLNGQQIPSLGYT